MCTVDIETKIYWKNAILDGCSTVDSTLDYNGIGWYLMIFWYSIVFIGTGTQILAQDWNGPD